MRIVILQDYLRSGGTERQSIFLTRWLRENGHEATLVTFRPGGPLANSLASSGYHVALQPFDFKADWMAPGLVRRLNEIAPQLILCMGRMANFRIERLRKAFPGMIVVGSMRTGKALSPAYQRSLRAANAVIANSRKARNRLIDEVGIPTGKVRVIHNAIVHRPPPVSDTPADRATARKAYGLSPDSVVLLCVAMFRPEKNQAGLIETCAKLPANANWQLWLVGDGPAENECRILTRRLGLLDRVRFFGFQDDPTPLYRAADISVLSSRSESLPNFLVESQWHGLPVVAEDVSGVGESFMPEKSGFLIRPEDREQFLQSLLTLINSAEKRSEMAAAAQQYARGAFDHDRQAQRTLQFFEELVSQAI